ncbi:MAG: type II secretion system protein GspK [Geminicoccaceae bacterium]
MKGSARERGAALVLVLVFTTAMAAAAVAFLAGRRTDALTLRGQLQAVEAEAMLDAALRETIAVIANKTPRQVVPDRLAWTLGDVAVQVRIDRESGKVDLNKAPASLLRALPMALGAKEEQAQTLAAEVQDWRDEDHRVQEGGAEDGEYRSGRTGPSGAADRPMANPAELLYLPGMDRGIWAALRPYVTIYTGASGPDARAASATVRQALQIARSLARDEPKEPPAPAGADANSTGGLSDPHRADAMGDSTSQDGLRSGNSGAGQSGLGGAGRGDGQGSDGAASSSAGGAGGGEGGQGAQTLHLDVRFANGYEAAAEAVVLLSNQGSQERPYTVLSWMPVLRAQREGS